MIRPLTSDEKQMIHIALGMRENYIETGTIAMDALTVQKMGDKAANEFGATIKALSVDQMKLLIASKELKTKILNNKLRIVEA